MGEIDVADCGEWIVGIQFSEIFEYFTWKSLETKTFHDI